MPLTGRPIPHTPSIEELRIEASRLQSEAQSVAKDIAASEETLRRLRLKQFLIAERINEIEVILANDQT